MLSRRNSKHFLPPVKNYILYVNSFFYFFVLFSLMSLFFLHNNRFEPDLK